MTYFSPHVALVLTAFVFISIVVMHVSHKNSGAVRLYIAQSIAVLTLFIGATIADITIVGILLAVLMLLTKLVAAPHFFERLIRKHQLTFSASTYLSVPLTLAVLGSIAAANYLKLEHALAPLAPEYRGVLWLACAGIFASLFLVVNRKGALSQMLGVLSLENSIIAFAALAGLEHAPILELGVVFIMLIWIVIATVFVSMMYEKFGSLDVTTMTHLTEE